MNCKDLKTIVIYFQNKTFFSFANLWYLKLNTAKKSGKRKMDKVDRKEDILQKTYAIPGIMLKV